MKKILTSLLVLAILSPAFGQDAKKFHFGLKAMPGIYWPKTSDENLKSNGSSFGFSYGAILEFGFADNYAFSTGMEVTSMGSKFTQTYTVLNITTVSSSELKLMYLQLPLCLKMKTNDIGGVKYFGTFGFGTSVNLKGIATTTTTVGGASPVITKESDKGENEIFPIRESLLVGLGIEYNLAGNTSLVAGLNFDNGFTPILNKKDDAGNEIPKAFCKGITLTAGILF